MAVEWVVGQSWRNFRVGTARPLPHLVLHSSEEKKGETTVRQNTLVCVQLQGGRKLRNTYMSTFLLISLIIRNDYIPSRDICTEKISYVRKAGHFSLRFLYAVTSGF